MHSLTLQTADGLTENHTELVHIALTRFVKAAPMLSEGDVLGCVAFVGKREDLSGGEVDYKLVQSIAAFLGRHMES